MNDHIIIFKEIKFYNMNFDDLLSVINEGGYLVAPAASALTNIDNDKNYHNALIKSDIAIFDSGFFCILLRIFKNKKVKKTSGYLFLKKFLNINFDKETMILSIDPNEEESKANIEYFKNKNVQNFKNYVAPYYNDNIEDQNLLDVIKKNNPRYIIINLGGGIQEPLALYIKNNINFKCSILCTGAAISFLTKKQAPINDIVDKLYLGWLWRTLYNPRKFLLRTIKSLNLIKQFIKN